MDMTYERYCQEIRSGSTIVHDDRIMLTALKNDRGRYFPLCEGWRESPILRSDGVRIYWANGREHRAKTYVYRNSMCPVFLRGTRITIAGNHIIIEIHNALNREPNRSRLALFVAILKELHKAGIIRPGSRSSFYRLAHRFKVSEYEIRYDHEPGKIPYKLIRMYACSHQNTHYFRDKGKDRTAMYTYPYPGFRRFEMILRKIDSIRGTARQIIGRLEKRIRNIWKKWPVYWELISPVFKRPVFLESLNLPGKDLYGLSQKNNQYFIKLM